MGWLAKVRFGAVRHRVGVASDYRQLVAKVACVVGQPLLGAPARDAK